jgi:Zn-dependent protease
MFIELLFENRQFYLTWILVVIISTVLHELAHGWAALRQGDDTPRLLGHMTGNPLVHMGPISLAALVFTGLAWGMMPVNPSRFRSKYGDAIVSFAGPSTNLMLSLLSLTSLGLLMRFDVLEAGSHVSDNLILFLRVMGTANFALALFNLLPVPPLDGSAILANFHHGYARFIGDPTRQGLFFLLFGMAFMLGRYMFGFAAEVSREYVSIVRGW